MNCPQCGIGVLETIGYIELDENKTAFTYSKFPPAQKPSLVISLCSRGCEYVDIKAAPDALYLARKRLLESANRHVLKEAAIDQ